MNCERVEPTTKNERLRRSRSLRLQSEQLLSKSSNRILGAGVCGSYSSAIALSHLHSPLIRLTLEPQILLGPRRIQVGQPHHGNTLRLDPAMSHLGNGLLGQLDNVVVAQASSGEDVTMSSRGGGGESVEMGDGEVGDGDEDLSTNDRRRQFVLRQRTRARERGREELTPGIAAGAPFSSSG